MNEENRLVFCINGDELEIIECGSHYGDKKNMDFEEAVRNRRSIRKFKPNREIPVDDLKKIVEIGMTAPNMGYGSCWVGLYPDKTKMDKVKEILNCDSIPFCAAVIGIPDESGNEREKIDLDRIHII